MPFNAVVSKLIAASRGSPCDSMASCFMNLCIGSFGQQVRRIAHAHAGMSWKCQRVDVSWTQATDHSDGAAAAAADDDDVDDDDELYTSSGVDISDHVIANFTGLVHSLHAWYRSIALLLTILTTPKFYSLHMFI